jgi:tetratricopeptide (TPR) repeat protein
VTRRLLGRDEELASLQRELVGTVNDGAARLVLVRGEPGIGKSALLKSFVDSVPQAASGQPVLTGYGQAMTNSLGSDAFQAIRECLRSMLSGAERSSSRESLSRVAHAFKVTAPDWLESVPMVGQLLAAGVKTGQTLAGTGPGRDHLNSRLDQITALIQELFASGAVVLVLDDLHWADGATIDVLMALALKVQGPLLLVAAYRPDDLRTATDGEPHPLARAVFRLRRYRPESVEIDLRPLSASDTASLVRGAHPGRAITDEQVDRLVAQSAGVPLYAESLAVVFGREGTPDVVGQPPREIAAVMEERLSYAAPGDQRLLEVAIAVGFTFEVQFLADLARTDLDDVYDRLDRLMREHHLIVEAESLGPLDRYALAHPMLAEVLRRNAEANRPRWRRLHQRLVDILLAQPISDEIAVRAASAAIVAQDSRATALALDAARRQYTAGAITKTRELAQAAMTVGSVSELSFDVVELLARSLSAEANHRDAAQVCAEALAVLTPGSVPAERLWDLMLLQIRSLRMVNDWSQAQHLLQELQAQLPVSAETVTAEVLMLRAEFALCGPDQNTQACIELCDQIATSSPGVELLSRAFGHRGLAHLATYQDEDAERWLRQAIAIARDEDHPYAVYEAVHWLSKKKMACLELDEAQILLEQLEAMAQASGVASDTPFHRRDTSRVLGLRGELDSATTAFLQYYDLAERQRDRAITTLACQVAELETIHGATAANGLLDITSATAADIVSDPQHLDDLVTAVGRLRQRPADWAVLPYVNEVMRLDPAEAVAAEAIFRFDVPDLSLLRREVAPGES